MGKLIVSHILGEFPIFFFVKFHYRPQNSPLLDPVCSLMKTIDIITPNIFTIRFNNIRRGLSDRFLPRV